MSARTGDTGSAAGRLARLVPLLLLAAGCARTPPPDLSLDPAALLEQVRAAQAGVTSCSGSARLGISSPDMSGSLDAWVAAERPGRVRVEVFDFFGNPAAILVAADGRFEMLDLRAERLYRGDDTPENLARLLPVPIGARDLSRLVCGSAPLVEGRPVSAVPGDGEVLLEIAGAAGREVVAVREEGAIRAATFLPGARGGAGWKARFGSFRHVHGQFLPDEVEVRGGGSEISLRWRDDREINGTLEPGLFRLAAPRGVEVIDLARGAAPPPIDLPLRPVAPPPR